MVNDVLSLLSLELARRTCSITGAARLGQVFNAGQVEDETMVISS